MGPPNSTDFSNDDFGNDADGDVTMGDAEESDVAAVDVAVVAAAAAPTTKRSRFIEAQRKRIEEKKRKAAEQKAAVAARVQAAQEATARAVAKQNANVHTARGTGGWWDQSESSKTASSSSSSNFSTSSSPNSTSNGMASTNATPAIDMIPKCMERAKDEDGDEYECIRMYFLDAYERQDRIYMFGKVWVPSDGQAVTKPGEGNGSFQSICVQITGNERQLFFLPRHWENPDQVDKVELYKEVKSLLLRGPLGSHDTFRCKFVDRNYAFELQGVPRQTTSYMKCKYSAKHGMLDNGLEGKHFSKCFGARTNCLENFLLKRRIMGPCWIEIRDPKNGTNASWCRVEALIENPKDVSVCKGSRNLDAPPVVVMSLDVKTRVNKQQKHEVVMISALVHKDVLQDKPTPNEMHRTKIGHFTVARSFAGPGLPGHISEQTRSELAAGRKAGKVNLKILGSSERGLLQFAMGQMSSYDPDMIVGHNINGHTMDVLMHRMSELRVSNWSRIGRLNLATFPRAYQRGKPANTRNFDRLAIGRLVVDTYSTAKELVRSESVYTLKAMAKKYCKAERLEILPLDVPNYFATTKSLLHLQHHTENGAYLSLQLMFRLEMLPLTKQLTNLGGNLWSKTLSGGRAERIEYLLLHEFHRRKYIVPDKIYKKKKGNGRREKSKYAGGLVLEPKKGLYDKYVLLLDFNSLYPSIIQEYNICFTTVERQLEGQENVDTSYGTTEEEQKAAGGDGMSNFVIPELPDATASTDSSGKRVWAVLPTLLKTLISRRSVVKRALKQEQDPIKKRLLHNKQLALKLTANSMYGCLGFKQSRFYAAPIAALVTQTGRELLQNTCDMTNAMGYEVIYGDTDSIMVYTNSTDLKEVQNIGKKVKKEVNKLYNLLEIEIDGVYKTMLLLKKKKYAAVMVKDKPDGSYVLETETKGLDLVRRDWCQLSKDIGLRCLEKILSGQETEEVVASIHEDCTNVAKSMRNGEVPLEKFSITKGLSKAPKDYPNAKNMPHVMVALGMVKNGRPVNVGDHIPYVICNETHPGIPETSKQSAATRAYHPDAVKAARERFAQEQQQATSSSTSTSTSATSSSSSTEGGTGDEKKKPALTIDIEWYLSQQILPPTERLCDPIEGTSRSMIATHLGLDVQKYAMSSYSGMSVDEDLIGYTPSTQMPDLQRYKNCRPLAVTCPSCKHTTSFTGVLNFVESGTSALQEAKSGLICKSCNQHEFSLAHMTNMLDMSIRQMTLEYYAGWSECTESTCANKTRQCSCLGGVCIMPECGSNTNETFSAGALYTQLKFYESLFDLQKWSEQLKEKLGMANLKQYLGTEQYEAFAALKERVNSHLATSDYQWIRPQMWESVFGGAKMGNKRVMA